MAEPSPEEVDEGVQGLASPEPPSVQFQATVTSPLFHPLPLAAGAAVGDAVGAVLSTCTVYDALPVLPKRSLHVADSTIAEPSPEEVDDCVQWLVSTPESL